LSKVYRPAKHIIGHMEENFYRSYDQTNSVKALRHGYGFPASEFSHKKNN